MQTGQRVAAAGMLVSRRAWPWSRSSAGLAGHSTAVVADGLESAGDVIASGFVLLGLTLAAKPADEDHPYGHGRVETLTGLLIGLVLTAGGALISWNSSERLGQPHEPLAAFVIWPLVDFARGQGRPGRLQVPLRPASCRATRSPPTRGTTPWTRSRRIVGADRRGADAAERDTLRRADRYGGFVVGLIVISAGVRVARDTAMQLMDTMPDDRA